MLILEPEADQTYQITVRKDTHRILYLNESDAQVTLVIEPVSSPETSIEGET